MVGLLASLGASLSAGADPAHLVMTQAETLAGTPLPRPLLGLAAPRSPVMPFHVALNYICPEGTAREQLFVSIADVVRQQDAGGTPQILRIEVPLKRMEWLSEAAMSCRNVASAEPEEVDSSGIRYYHRHAGAMAYATLSCLSAGGRTSTATASTPLDVWLSCPVESPKVTPPAASGDAR